MILNTHNYFDLLNTFFFLTDEPIDCLFSYGSFLTRTTKTDTMQKKNTLNILILVYKSFSYKLF